MTFAYQNGDIILDDVSLRVNKGDLIAIVGESGIGKSTMMKLMLHLMPCESGKLYFETVNGKIEIDAGTRNVFSYVPQGNMIMSGTIRENITFCNHDTSARLGDGFDRAGRRIIGRAGSKDCDCPSNIKRCADFVVRRVYVIPG